MKPPVITRRRMRELALRVLFEVDIGRQPVEPALARIRADVPEPAWPFVRALCEGTWRHRAEIDGRLAPLLRGWRLDRLVSTDRAVLRLAVYELLHTDTPANVIISEAVELAKTYGTDDSGRFVNGVLGTLQRQRGDTPPDHDG